MTFELKSKQYEFDSICGHLRHDRVEQAKSIHDDLTEEEREAMHLYFCNELNDRQLSFEAYKKLK